MKIFKSILFTCVLVFGLMTADIFGQISEPKAVENGGKLIGLFSGNITMYNTNDFEAVPLGALGYSINTKTSGFLGSFLPDETFAIAKYGQFEQGDTVEVTTDVYEIGAMGLYYFNSDTLFHKWDPFFLLGGLLETLNPEGEAAEGIVESNFEFTGNLGVGTFLKFNERVGLFGAVAFKFTDDFVFNPMLGFHITM